MSLIEPVASDAASSVGLTGTQKGAAITSALPRPRTHHPYLVGLILIGSGLFMLVGSITGTLPSMLAALFVPTALVDSNGNSPGAPSGGGPLGYTANELQNMIKNPFKK